MKTSALIEFVKGLSNSLAAVAVPSHSLDDLRSVADMFGPFRDLELGQVAEFLKRAAEYRETGAVTAVTVPGLDGVATASRRIAQTVHDLDGADPAQVANLERQVTEAKEELQSALTTLAGSTGLTLKATNDKNWLTGISKRAAARRAAEKFQAETAKLAAALRQLLPQITSHESYQTEAVRSVIDGLADTESEVLKAAALELGAADVKIGKKVDVRKVVESILAKVTSIEAKEPKAPRKLKPTKVEVPKASDEAFQSMVQSINEMIEKTSDPDAVSEAEINAILTRVGRDFPDDQQKAIAKAVTGKGGRTAEAAIALLRDRLTAVKRGLEGQKV